jgi:hypothetical protein
LTIAHAAEVRRVPSPFAAGLTALRRFWRPFLLIQAAAVGLVIAYHLSATVRGACDLAAAAKVRGGLPFAAIIGAVAGGVLPELATRIADRRRRGPGPRADALGFNLGFFALNGVVIDLLYRFEAHLFGYGGSLATVAAKTAFDQFVFTPAWLWVIVALFAWRASGFSAAAMRPLLRDRFYRRRVLPLLIPNWCFWIPMVSIIYALPSALQFLLFVLVFAAWSLIMVFIAEG